MTDTAFDVVAETTATVDDSGAVVLTSEETPTLSVGMKVRIADPAFTVYGGYVTSDAFGKVGEIVSDRLRTGEGYEVQFAHPSGRRGQMTNHIGGDYLTPLTEAELLREELTAVRIELDIARQNAEAALAQVEAQSREHEAWKANLQEVAYEAARANDMCGVFDRVMEQVGLEGREREFELRVEFSGATWVNVTATSRENARAQIDLDMIRDRIAESGHYDNPVDNWDVEED